MNRIASSLQRVIFFHLLTVSLLFECPAASLVKDAPRPTLTVGSKSIQEGILLGKLMVGTLQRKGFNVVDRTNMGSTDDLRKALKSRAIDLYPEYTGTAGLFFPDVDPSVWKDSKLGYETAKRLDKEKNEIIWLTPAPAENSWVIAVTRDLANQGISDLPKFATFVNNGGAVILGSIKELVLRSDGLPAFTGGYHFTLRHNQILVLDQPKPAGPPAAPPKDFNALLTLGSSAQIAGWNMVILKDPAKVPMVFRPTPITRPDVIAEHGKKIDEALGQVFQSLNMATLIRLNTRVVVEKLSPDEVAKAYLDEIKVQSESAAGTASR